MAGSTVVQCEWCGTARPDGASAGGPTTGRPRGFRDRAVLLYAVCPGCLDALDAPQRREAAEAVGAPARTAGRRA